MQKKNEKFNSLLWGYMSSSKMAGSLCICIFWGRFLKFLFCGAVYLARMLLHNITAELNISKILYSCWKLCCFLAHLWLTCKNYKLYFFFTYLKLGDGESTPYIDLEIERGGSSFVFILGESKNFSVGRFRADFFGAWSFLRTLAFPITISWPQIKKQI